MSKASSSSCSVTVASACKCFLIRSTVPFLRLLELAYRSPISTDLYRRAGTISGGCSLNAATNYSYSLYSATCTLRFASAASPIASSKPMPLCTRPYKSLLKAVTAAYDTSVVALPSSSSCFIAVPGLAGNCAASNLATHSGFSSLPSNIALSYPIRK